jgi:hypothetical protein
MRGLKPAAFAVVACAASLALHVPTAGAFDVLAFHPDNLGVDGGAENWHPSRAFTVRWDDPPGSSVAVVHYRVREPDGTESYSGQVPSDPRFPTGSLSIDVRDIVGAYTVEVWLQDPGGTQGPTATTKLRFDKARPREAAPQPISGWIGRAAIPYSVHLSHPGDPQPISGIKGYAVSVDSNPSGNPCAAADRCSDGETDLRGGVDDDTLGVEGLPEGTDYIHAVAVSGSGMKSQFVETTVVHVDTTMPVTRLAGLPSTTWTDRSVILTATATDATSGMSSGSSLTAIRVDGGVPTVASGDAVGVAVIGEGVHDIAYYARDAAGNINDGSGDDPPQQPSTAVVRIDRDAPSASFLNSQNPEDPEQIEVRVSDPMSGPDPSKGRIEVRRAESGDDFEALPTESAAGKLRAHWDSDSYPAGEYEFRATGYDAAGNSVTTARRANGTSMLLPSPLKVPTAVHAGFGGRTLVLHRCARRKGGQRHCWREAIEAFSLRPATRLVRYGRGTLFSGQLIAGLGAPLGRMPVQIIERFDPGANPPQRVTTVQAGADGIFTAHLAPGPSRTVTAVFAGTRTLTRSAGRPLRLGVRAGVRMSASEPVAAIGGRPVVFRGQVEADGAAIPPDGKAVQLQFRAPGIPWTEFRTVQTDGRGRFRYPYSFTDNDSRGVRFEFRAFAPAQSDWPYEPSSSGPVAVRGR